MYLVNTCRQIITTMKFKILLSLTLMLTSCISYHFTSDSGVRVDDPKVFKYNKPRFAKRSMDLIDTNAVYCRDSTYDVYFKPQWKLTHKEYARFFGTGQVLFINCDSFLDLRNVNNPNVGTPGYFITDVSKLKIDMFQQINGGQTGKYYGRIQSNGDIVFYEQAPETYHSSFFLLEKMERDERISVWKKVKIDTLVHYRPDW